MIVIDATDLILGRMATYAAKQAMLGNEIRIINAEKAVISGKKENTYEIYLTRRARGIPLKGPYIHRTPEKIVRRAIRGMLPYKKPRGKEAYKRVLCYFGEPEEFKDKAITLKEANRSKLPDLKYVTIKDISRRLGAKVE